MCKFFNAEADDTFTRHGGNHLTKYRFLHKVGGETEAVEWLMAPNIGGFHKRNDFVESPDHQVCDKKQPAEESKLFIRNNFTHLFTHVNAGDEQRRRPDDHALSLYDAVHAGIGDFMVTDAGKKLTRWPKVKLGFADSDILKNSSVRARWCEYGETYAADLEEHLRLPLIRDKFDVFELMYGARAWLRQLQWHILFYKWYASFGRAAIDKGLHTCFEGAPNPQTKAEKLEAPGKMDYMAHVLMAHVGHAGPSSTTMVYSWIRHDSVFKIENKYQLVHEACARLVAKRIVD